MKAAPKRRSSGAGQSRAALQAEIKKLRDELAAEHAENEIDRAQMQEIEISRHRYADLFDFAPVGYAGLTRNGCLREINLTGARLFGRPRESLIGRPVLPLLCKADRHLWLNHLRELRSAETGAVEVGVAVKGGPPVVLRFHTVRLKSRGPALGPGPVLRTAILDVTTRRRAEEDLRRSEQRYQLVGDLIPFGVWEANPQGEATYLSPSFLEMTGQTLQEHRRTWQELLHPDDVRPTAEAWQECLAQGALWEHEFRVRDKAGNFRSILARGLPVRDEAGRIVFYVGINFDITARRQAEDELRRTAEDLIRSNRDLEQFAYVASHDLREPLRAVTAYTELLRERYQGQLDAKGDQYISFATQGARRMQALIEDLLAYSRVGIEVADPGPIRAQEALDAALGDLKPWIEASGARIVRGRLPTVTADRLHLAQVFQNLIGNSLKYRSPDAAPEVHIGARRVSEPRPAWLFFVRDNGIGIDARFFDRIFEIFQRLHPRGRYGGTGIGLAICRRIVDRHGGRIWVESEEGKGSTFFFTIPDTIPRRAAVARQEEKR